MEQDKPRRKINRNRCNVVEPSPVNIQPAVELEGGLRVKKVEKIYRLQDDINKSLYERVPISAFIEEAIVTKIKNTVGIKCKKCGSEDVFSESRQTRSADEAMTVFYTCLNCGNKWKVN